MSTVTQTPAGWSFLHKGQRYEYPTKDEAQAAVYDLQRGRPAPAPRTAEPPNDLEYARQRAATLPPIRMERQTHDEGPNIGEEYATSFFVGEGDDAIELYVPDKIEKGNWIALVNFGGDFCTLNRAWCDTLSLLHLLDDPTVTAAIALAEARAEAEARRAA